MSDIPRDGKSIKIWFSESQYAELTEYAKERDLKKGQLVRLALIKIGAISEESNEYKI